MLLSSTYFVKTDFEKVFILYCVFLSFFFLHPACSDGILPIWVNIFRIIPEFRILRLIFHRMSQIQISINF